MNKTNGPVAKKSVILAGYLASGFALGACVQIVGMDDPTLVDRLDEPTASSGGGGKGSSSSSSSSGKPGSTSGSGASSSSSSSGGNGSVASVWADWPMPNPASAGLPNPANYVVDSLSDSVLDSVTKLTWQRAVVPSEMSLAEAKAYCEGLVASGFGDWRLPSRIELVSLVDYTKTAPAIDATAFPETPGAVFWTSSPKVSLSMSEVWTVDFNNGATDSADAATAHRVRCVR